MERRYILAGGLASELFHTISAVVYGYESFVLQARHGVATAASVRIPSPSDEVLAVTGGSGTS